MHGLVHGSYILRVWNYDNLLTDIVQIECELALSTTKATFSEAQERIWSANTELNHFLNVSELDQAVSLLK